MLQDLDRRRASRWPLSTSASANRWRSPDLGGIGETPLSRRPRWTPRCVVLSRALVYRYERSLRPSLGTTSAPLQRATFHQALLARGRGGLTASTRAMSEIDTSPRRRPSRSTRPRWTSPPLSSANASIAGSSSVSTGTASAQRKSPTRRLSTPSEASAPRSGTAAARRPGRRRAPDTSCSARDRPSVHELTIVSSARAVTGATTMKSPTRRPRARPV